jgi:hypothetical protein
MDTEQMGTLGKAMQRDAGQIRTLSKQLDGQLKGAWWKGTDADRFRADWDGNHRAGLEKLAAALDAQAKLIATNVAQQTQPEASSTSTSTPARTPPSATSPMPWPGPSAGRRVPRWSADGPTIAATRRHRVTRR